MMDKKKIFELREKIIEKAGENALNKEGLELQYKDDPKAAEMIVTTAAKFLNIK